MRSSQLPGYRTVARTATRDCPIALHQRGREYVITSCGDVLMSNGETSSEQALGRLAARLLRAVPRPRVLVGGLGMGFTLRAALDGLPGSSRVVVAELLGPVVSWNRSRLGHLSRHALNDPRVRVHIGDVAGLLPGRPVWDAILLDVDNGPEWIVQRRNQALYAPRGLRRFLSSLRPGGFLALWSVRRHVPFEHRILSMGLRPRRFRTMARAAGGDIPRIYVVSPTLHPGPRASWVP